MPFWVTWFLIGAFVTTTAAYSSQNASSVAALKAPPAVVQHMDEGGQEAN
jgi:hypothetical protein